jgi:hypothetical protein
MPAERRRIRFSLKVRSMLGLGLALQLLLSSAASPASAATSYRYIVYLMGTAFSTPVTPVDGAALQQDYRWITSAMTSTTTGVGVPLSRQLVLNYTDDHVAAATWALSPVVTSWHRHSPLASCRGATSPNMIDGWTHAYNVAWWLDGFYDQHVIDDHVAPRILLVGHSQGGVIARMLQVISTNVSPYSTGDLRADCWPMAHLKSMLEGIVTVGAPLASVASGLCPQFSTGVFETERRFIYAHPTAAGRGVVVGAEAAVWVGAPTSPWIAGTCSTAVSSSATTKIEMRDLTGASWPLTSVKFWNGYQTTSTPTTQLFIATAYASKFVAGQDVLLGNMGPAVLARSILHVRHVYSPGIVVDVAGQAERVAPVKGVGPTVRRVTNAQYHTEWIEGDGTCPAAPSVSSSTCQYRSATAGNGYPSTWTNTATGYRVRAKPWKYDLTPAGYWSQPVYDTIAKYVRAWAW